MRYKINNVSFWGEKVETIGIMRDLEFREIVFTLETAKGSEKGVCLAVLTESLCSRVVWAGGI